MQTREAVVLAQDDLQRADAALRRLHESAREFLDALDPSARTATEMSDALGVQRTTCQRLCYVATRPYAGLQSVSRYPGRRALLELVRAAQGHGVTGGAPTALQEASSHFDRVAKEVAGSVSRLNQAQASTESPAGQEQVPGAELTEAAFQLTGRRSRAWVASYYIRRSTESPGHLEVWRAAGLHGHQARSPSAPLSFRNFGEGDAPDDAAHGVGFIESLCTQTERHITSRSERTFLSETIELAPSHDPVDVFMQYEMVLEPSGAIDHGVEEVWALINLPAEAMVFDVHLDHELARACVVNCDVHLWQPDLYESKHTRWSTRLPVQTRLGVLTPDTPVESPHYPHMRTLTEHLFSHAGVKRNATTGYRCEVRHPAWRCGYRMLMDFSTPDPG
ncbi:MAG: hypothetical protein AAGH64_09065 [Planctomycetota bacterium]